MISPVELHRILGEWRVRLSRVKDILQPPTWDKQEWRQFAQALALMVRDHGRSWIIDPNVYWDLRWNLQDGGELVCQIEHIPGEKTSLVVAQNGGFAESVGSYTWLWAEFNMEGHFSRDPYWVEGSWKEALTALLLPLDRQAGFLLAGRAQTPDSLLLQDGARPNDQHHLSLMQGMDETGDFAAPEYPEGKTYEAVSESVPPAPPEREAEKPVEIIAETNGHSSPESAAEKRADATVVETNGHPAPESRQEKPVETVVETNGHAKPIASEEKSTGEVSPRIDTPAPFAIRWGMAQKLTWRDSDEIAYALIDTYPDQDPMKLSFPKLHAKIIALEDFGDDPEKSSESILEAIQMAWYEEVK